MVMSQSRIQQDVGITEMKMAMDTGKENAIQIDD
ncbi:YjfB family protein [Clostridium estertheticum]|nr:YjfB family protein [Clostridium estertheticum]MCB2356694.1 YjfB family protein [Clostridium estertheticum]WAG42778.1 YjfB family protein [Clostridium estertheticum]